MGRTADRVYRYRTVGALRDLYDRASRRWEIIWRDAVERGLESGYAGRIGERDVDHDNRASAVLVGLGLAVCRHLETGVGIG